MHRFPAVFYGFCSWFCSWKAVVLASCCSHDNLKHNQSMYESMGKLSMSRTVLSQHLKNVEVLLSEMASPWHFLFSRSNHLVISYCVRKQHFRTDHPPAKCLGCSQKAFKPTSTEVTSICEAAFLYQNTSPVEDGQCHLDPTKLRVASCFADKQDFWFFSWLLLPTSDINIWPGNLAAVRKVAKLQGHIGAVC